MYRSIDRSIEWRRFERGFRGQSKELVQFSCSFRSIERQSTPKKENRRKKKKKLTTCNAWDIIIYHRTFTLLLLDLPRFCAVQIRLLAVQQQARLLVIVFVFVLGDAVFDLFPRGTIWTRASVVTSRVRRRFDVLLTVFPPLVPVVVADHGVRWRVEKRTSIVAPSPSYLNSSSFSKRRRCTRCCCCCCCRCCCRVLPL